MGYETEHNNTIVPKKFTTLYIHKSTKEQLDKLKLTHESNEGVIERLLRRRNFDVVNNEIVQLDDKFSRDVVIKLITSWQCHCPDEHGGVDTSIEKQKLMDVFGINDVN